jgi:hypothetical protein
VTLADSPAVRRWFASAGHDDDPPEEQERRLALLADFCAQTGQSPDEWVALCLRTTKAGDAAVSHKGRVAAHDAIEAFVAKAGWEGKEAVVKGNQLRGFLIHNGIFMQGRAWRG